MALDTRDLQARAAVREVFAAIIGSGFAGVAAAVALKRAGIDDLVLLERAPMLGGVWRDNRYPGCACDIPSYLYSFSFAPDHRWTRAYAPQQEIWAYLEDVADAQDVRRHILFERDVAEAGWHEGRARWRLRCRSGETIDARVLVVAVGALSTPEIPPLPGVERFRGARFHSARWDPAYDLRGKRVAVVGTGASAVQFVPHIQPLVERLHVFQRTAPWIIPRHDRAFGPWARRILRHAPGARWLYRQLLYWRHEGRVLAFVHHTWLMRVLAWQARRHMARSIRDPALRELLTPRYQPGCKRILLSDDYYPALAQPNVELITDAIEEVEEDAIRVAGGRRIEVDAILYGTGFRVHDYLCGLEIFGRDGARLRALWGEGAQAYLGTLVAGFPNLFVMTGPNSGLGHNSMLLIMEAQARYLRNAAALLRDGRAASLEVSRDAQDAYNAWIRKRHVHSVWSSGCRSWYLDSRGRNTTLWPGAAASFRLRTARLRPQDLELRPAPETGA